MTDEKYRFKKSLYDSFKKPEENSLDAILDEFLKSDISLHDLCHFYIEELGLRFDMSWEEFCIKIKYLYTKLLSNGYLSLNDFLNEFGFGLGSIPWEYQMAVNDIDYESNEKIGKSIGIDLTIPKKELRFRLSELFK